MKKSNRGFTLVETLIVSAFIIGILIFLFSQFAKLKKSYDTSFENNTVPALYKAKNINRFLSSGNDKLIIQLENSDVGFLDITDCPMDYITKIDYCTRLFSDLEVEAVFVAKESTFKSELQEYLKDNNTTYHEKLYRFVQSESINNENYDGYRIIAEFADNQFATVRLNH